MIICYETPGQFNLHGLCNFFSRKVCRNCKSSGKDESSTGGSQADLSSSATGCGVTSSQSFDPFLMSAGGVAPVASLIQAGESSPGTTSATSSTAGNGHQLNHRRNRENVLSLCTKSHRAMIICYETLGQFNLHALCNFFQESLP